MQLLELDPQGEVQLDPVGHAFRRVHQFDEDSVLAVQTAYAANRPLLLRGEPGVGKSQLAEAVAVATKRRWVPFVVDSNTEPRDLLWRFDAIQRLADAQLVGALGADALRRMNESTANEFEDCGIAHLPEENYVIPGPLWWGFDWQGAKEQNRRLKNGSVTNFSGRPDTEDQSEKVGCVVLIDEIDKGETEVPNGLLQALGAGEFRPYAMEKSIRAKDPRPLIVITTNEERALPDAFVRRCIVHFIDLPDATEESLTAHLVRRGRAHFPEADTKLLKAAATQLCADRSAARREQLKPFPGQAEYLDLLRATIGQSSDPEKQLELLELISKFALKKNRGRA